MKTLLQTLYRIIKVTAPALAVITTVAMGMAAESPEAMLLSVLLTAFAAIWLGMAWGIEE